jgi:hypothetical protein
MSTWISKAPSAVTTGYLTVRQRSFEKALRRLAQRWFTVAQEHVLACFCAHASAAGSLPADA